MLDRKVIQITASNRVSMDGLSISILYALCSDGTMWFLEPGDDWKQLPKIPNKI